MTVRSRLSIYAAVLTFIFLISPGTTLAEPSLGLSAQSDAHYQLIAEYRTIQSCSASPSNYTFIACGQQSGLHSTTSNVNVTDDGKCLPNSAACSFVPASVTINEGDSIEWHNVGSLNHTIIFGSSGFSSISLVNSTLPFKTNQPLISSVGFQRFDVSGTFTYHDQRYSWMTGTITVNSLRSVPPRVQETNTTGPVGWTVIGLDNNAVLSFNHALTTTTNSTGSTKTTTNESGTFEEIVNLSTRKETPGIASSFRYIPPIFLSGLGLGQLIGGYYPYYYYPPQDVYTIWWVNGPLNLGSSVELLTSTAAVTGSSFQISGAKYPSWTVKSNFLEAYNQTEPLSQQIFPVGPPFPVVGPGGFYPGYPSYFTAGYSDSLAIAFEYGQKSDLLFSAAADTRNYNKQVTVYPPGSIIYPYYGGYSVLAAHGANVTNTYDTTSAISLKLQSTNLDLSQRTTPPPTGGGGTQSPTANAPSPMTMWLYASIGVVAAVAVVGIVWTGTRIRRRASTALSGPSTVTPAVDGVQLF